jgi:hypothetical protein
MYSIQTRLSLANPTVVSTQKVFVVLHKLTSTYCVVTQPAKSTNQRMAFLPGSLPLSFFSL